MLSTVLDRLPIGQMVPVLAHAGEELLFILVPLLLVGLLLFLNRSKKDG